MSTDNPTQHPKEPSMNAQQRSTPMTTKEAETKVQQARQEQARAQKVVREKRIELAAMRSKMDKPKAVLSRVKALKSFSTADLVAQTNAERELGRLAHDESELTSAVESAEGEVHTAGLVVERAQQSLARAQLETFQVSLLERVAAMDAELVDGIATLSKLCAAAGVSGDVVTEKLRVGPTRPLEPALVLAGEALKFARATRHPAVRIVTIANLKRTA